MPRRSALCALLVLAAAAPASAAAGPHRDRCHRPELRTVALDRQLRVVVDDDSGYYYACLRRSGRRTLLWEQDDIYVNGSLLGVAGRFAAYVVGDSPGCKNDCPPGVTTTWTTGVADARSGRTRALRDPSVRDVRLAASGAFAWVAGERPGDTLSVWRLGDRARVVGAEDVTGVRASGGRLRWSDARGAHSVPFG